MPVDFYRLANRYHQFGGWRLVWQYTKMRVLWTGVIELAKCVLHGCSFKVAYPAITKNIDKRLLRQYQYLFDLLEKEDTQNPSSICCGDWSNKQNPKIAWVIWLQGFDNAPEMVRMCVASQQKHLTDYEFRFVTEANYHDWVTLPQYLEVKRQKGRIPDALFSDLLRTEVLVKYGGLYMDATVLCTGLNNERLRTHWTKIEESELFLFRYFKRGDLAHIGLSNWFLSVRPYHPVMTAVRDVLFSYWHDYDCLVDYYIMHLFLDKALSYFPELLATMPRGNSFHSIILGDMLGRDFNKDVWQDLIDHVSFHKLNFRKATDAAHNPNSYYNNIIMDYHKSLILKCI